MYLMGNDQWCGSGGYTTLVLSPRGTSYRVVAYLTTTWPPIRVLTKKSHGWHDIAVWAEGAEIVRPHESVYSFNGRRYPNEPSAHRGERKLPGKTVIPSIPIRFNAAEIGKPLYP